VATDRITIAGIVRNGLVVPQGPVALPEGLTVEIVVDASHFTPNERAEFDDWDQAGEEAWAWIEEWEREHTP
jgi:hypothetical protein